MKISACLTTKTQEGKPLYQYLAAATSMLAIITSGMHYGWPSPSLPILEKTQPVSNDQLSWMAVMPLLGSVVGSLIVASIVDILGRKKTIIFSTCPFFAAWVMVASSQSVTILYVARFIAGVADGWVFTAVPMYIGEIAEPKIRGFLGAGVSVTWIFGILLINIIGSYQSITITALISSIIPVLALLTFIWMPESPYFLLMRGMKDEALSSLQKFRGKDDVDCELNRISKAVEAQTQNTGKFLDLFTVKSNRKGVIIIMGLRGSQQLCGTTVITFYTQKIFKEAGEDIPPELVSILYCTVQLILAAICSTIVDRAGRRPLLIASMSGAGVALFLGGTYFLVKTCTSIDVTNFSYIPVAALFLFVVVFNFGMQSIPILMLGEIFPANVKAFALCLADIYFSFVATIVSKCFQILNDSFGMYLPFYFFTGSCVLGLLFIIFFVPETKGKTLEEIQQLLGGKSGKEVEDNSNVLSFQAVKKSSDII